jgi:hypothetical protein
MPKFEESFLEEMGAVNLSEAQRKKFLDTVQEELERRIGAKLCAGKTAEQMQVLDRISLGSSAVITEWLDAEFPDYRSGKTYRVMEKSGLKGHALLSQTALCLWLDRNCPDYGDMADRCYRELREELLAQREQIFPPEGAGG